MAKAAGKKAPKKASKKAAAKKPSRKASAKKAAPKKSAARKSPAKKTAGKKTAAKKTTARKTAAKKAPAKKAARKGAAKKTTAKKTARKAAPRKAAAKKTAAKKAPAKKAAAKRPAAKQAASKSAAARKPPGPSRARVLSREGTPVARKVTIRTAVSRPTSPRKKREDAPPPEAQTQDMAPESAEEAVQDNVEETAPEAGELEVDVVQSQEPAFFLGLLAAIGAFEAFLDEESDETRAEAERRADDLIKAFQEPAVLDDGKTLDEDMFARLVEEAGATERMAQWLADLPKSESVDAFFDKKP